MAGSTLTPTPGPSTASATTTAGTSANYSTWQLDATGRKNIRFNNTTLQWEEQIGTTGNSRPIQTPASATQTTASTTTTAGTSANYSTWQLDVTGRKNIRFNNATLQWEEQIGTTGNSKPIA
jgi:hypothetical protein